MQLQPKRKYSLLQMVLSHVEYERQTVKRNPLYLRPVRSCDRGDSSSQWQQVLYLLLSMMEQPFKKGDLSVRTRPEKNEALYEVQPQLLVFLVLLLRVPHISFPSLYYSEGMRLSRGNGLNHPLHPG